MSADPLEDLLNLMSYLETIVPRWRQYGMTHDCYVQVTNHLPFGHFMVIDPTYVYADVTLFRKRQKSSRAVCCSQATLTELIKTTNATEREIAEMIAYATHLKEQR